MTEAFFDRADGLVHRIFIRLAARRRRATSSQGFALIEALVEMRAKQERIEALNSRVESWAGAYEREALDHSKALRRVAELEAREARWIRATDTMKQRIDKANARARRWAFWAGISAPFALLCLAGLVGQALY